MSNEVRVLVFFIFVFADSAEDLDTGVAPPSWQLLLHLLLLRHQELLLHGLIIAVLGKHHNDLGVLLFFIEG